MRTAPPPLAPGDTIAIVAPAGNIHDRLRYMNGCSLLRDMGFQILEQQKEWPGKSFLADDDESRVKEFMAVWCRPDVKAVFALRGGYGSLRIAAQLDLDVIGKHPKFLIGFSDITILLNHIACHANLLCLHGPVVSSLAVCERNSIDRLYHCITGDWHRQLTEKVEVIRAAPDASGTLMGGNLSSLVTLLGTGLDLDYQDSILLLEDVNEPLYRLDRLLTQFHLAGKFTGVKGLILGDFCSCDDLDRHEQQRTEEFVWKRVSELAADQRVPIWGRFPVGHNRQNIAMPIGAHCTMDSARAALSFTAG